MHSFKQVLVTGSAGFIGCNFVRFLLNQYPHIRIVSLDKLTYAGDRNSLPEAKNHVFVQGDICDGPLVSRLLEEHNIDTIVHFAAESHVDQSIHSPSKFVQTNVVGTFTLLEAARQHWLVQKKQRVENCRFHHISTDEVYGSLHQSDPAFQEVTPYAPNSPYSASKAGSDHFVRAYHHTYGLPVTTSNCSNNYGPYQHKEKFIPTVIRSCFERKPIPVYGNGTNIRDWLYVDDHCSAIDVILRNGKVGETYNVGGKTERRNIDLAHLICQIFNEIQPLPNFDYANLIQFVTDRLGHDWRYAIDNTKIQTQLSWQPNVVLRDGLLKTIAFYQK